MSISPSWLCKQVMETNVGEGKYSRIFGNIFNRCPHYSTNSKEVYSVAFGYMYFMFQYYWT